MLHVTNMPIRIQEGTAPERAAIEDDGYALITDRRIPQRWFLSEPGEIRSGRSPLTPAETKEVKEIYRAFFRAAE